jgi:hypothetical protein
MFGEKSPLELSKTSRSFDCLLEQGLGLDPTEDHKQEDKNILPQEEQDLIDQYEEEEFYDEEEEQEEEEIKDEVEEPKIKRRRPKEEEGAPEHMASPQDEAEARLNNPDVDKEDDYWFIRAGVEEKNPVVDIQKELDLINKGVIAASEFFNKCIEDAGKLKETYKWGKFNSNKAFPYLKGTSKVPFGPYPTQEIVDSNIHFNLRSGREGDEYKAILAAAGVSRSSQLTNVKIFEGAASTRLAKSIGNMANIHYNRAIVCTDDQGRAQKLFNKLHQVWLSRQKHEMDKKQTFKKFCDNNVCNCFFEDKLCEHFHAQKPDVFVMTHLNYYLKDEIISEILNTGCKIALTTHVFKPICNSGAYNDGIRDEARWWKKDGNIKFKVMNDKTYHHRDALNFLYYTWNYSGDGYSINVVCKQDYGSFQQISAVIVPQYGKKDIKFKSTMTPSELNSYLLDELGEEKEEVLFTGQDKVIEASRLAQSGNTTCITTISDDSGKDLKIRVRSIAGKIEFAPFYDTELSFFKSLNPFRTRYYSSTLLGDYFQTMSFAPKHKVVSMDIKRFNSLVGDLMVMADSRDSYSLKIYQMLKKDFALVSDPTTIFLVLNAALREVVRLESALTSFMQGDLFKIKRDVINSKPQGAIKKFIKKKMGLNKTIDITEDGKVISETKPKKN